MFWIGFGIYTIFMVLIFGFFIVAKIHVYKFSSYSIYIPIVTKILGLTLLLLALIGYYILWNGSAPSTSNAPTVGESTSTEIY